MYPMTTVQFVMDYYDDQEYKIQGTTVLLKGEKYSKGETHRFKTQKALELIREGYAIELDEE